MKGYSEALRLELCKKAPSNIQEAFVELQGIIGSRKKSGNNLIYTERLNVANRVTILWKMVFGNSLSIDITKYKNAYRFSIKLSEEYFKLLDWQGEMPRDFLRGVFLACGFISDPEKCYRIELLPLERTFTHYITRALDAIGIRYTIYIRKVSIVGFPKVEKFLSSIGIRQGLIKLEEIRTLKLIKEDTNRRINFQESNIEKTLLSAERELEAIKTLIVNNKLPDKYRKIAELRLTYPQATLRELAELSQPPVSKSTIAYYMRKLEKLADDNIKSKS
ncbi:MAG: DNA-binding protein WhiA [bacterium]|nr:DNA-binding protein WhiA [bacterium]